MKRGKEHTQQEPVLLSAKTTSQKSFGVSSRLCQIELLILRSFCLSLH